MYFPTRLWTAFLPGAIPPGEGLATCVLRVRYPIDDALLIWKEWRS